MSSSIMDWNYADTTSSRNLELVFCSIVILRALLKKPIGNILFFRCVSFIILLTRLVLSFGLIEGLLQFVIVRWRSFPLHFLVQLIQFWGVLHAVKLCGRHNLVAARQHDKSVIPQSLVTWLWPFVRFPVDALMFHSHDRRQIHDPTISRMSLVVHRISWLRVGVRPACMALPPLCLHLFRHRATVSSCMSAVHRPTEKIDHRNRERSDTSDQDSGGCESFEAPHSFLSVCWASIEELARRSGNLGKCSDSFHILGITKHHARGTIGGFWSAPKLEVDRSQCLCLTASCEIYVT